MNASILACGLVDEVGIAGTRGIQATWQELEMQAPGTGKTMKVMFDKADATFRRIDLLARCLVLACEAADLENVLSADLRQETAICVETDLGALATDLSFASSLDDECVHAGIFPYSLTSTCLGEVALRYKLRGPTVSMSVRDGDAGEALREALRLLHSGDLKHVVTGTVNTLSEASAGRPAVMRGLVTVLSSDDVDTKLGTLNWPERGAAEDPFAQVRAMCR